jgi:hypothetical protein
MFSLGFCNCILSVFVERYERNLKFWETCYCGTKENYYIGDGVWIRAKGKKLPQRKG